MPKPKRQFVTRVPNGGGLHLSNAGIAVIASLLALLAVMYKVAVSVALKDDIRAAESTLDGHIKVVEGKVDSLDNRERNLELGFARFFGKGAEPSPSSGDAPPSPAPLFLRVQYKPAEQSAVQQSVRIERRIVVKDWFIKQFDLHPARGGSYTVLGEDGQAYSLDDVIAALIDIHEQNRQRWEQLRMKK